jgi:hypothetical protein
MSLNANIAVASNRLSLPMLKVGIFNTGVFLTIVRNSSGSVVRKTKSFDFFLSIAEIIEYTNVKEPPACGLMDGTKIPILILYPISKRIKI